MEGLESGVVEKAGGKRGERGFPFFSNGGTHACRGPVCFKLEHLVGCPCSVGIGISTLWLFLSEARCRALQGERLDGRGAGRQRVCCDKFVTHVTELSQKKVFAKCLKPCGAMRPESCEAFGVPRFRRPSGSYPYGSESSGVPAGCNGGLAA